MPRPPPPCPLLLLFFFFKTPLLRNVAKRDRAGLMKGRCREQAKQAYGVNGWDSANCKNKANKKNKTKTSQQTLIAHAGTSDFFYWRRRCRDARSSVAQAWSANFGHDDSQIWRLRHNIRDPSTCFVPPPSPPTAGRP